MNTDQKEDDQNPQWLEDASKWRDEDTNKRAFVIFAVDSSKYFGLANGGLTSIIAAITDGLNTHEDLVYIFEEAIKLVKDKEKLNHFRIGFALKQDLF